MKTYKQYLKIIQDREYEENRPSREAAQKIHEEHKGDPEVLCTCYAVSINTGKMTFDYSVEIMGMMMQDFLKELNNEKKTR